MLLLRRSLFVAPAALVIFGLSGNAAHALPPAGSVGSAAGSAGRLAERTLFTWNGTIDREVLIAIRGRTAETRASGIDASFPSRFDVRDDLPRENGLIAANLVSGRGTAEVVQQPSARNDFTALVRIVDARAGRDNYRLVVAWEPYNERRDDRRDDRRGDRDNDRDDDRWNDRNGNRDRGGDGNRGRNGRDDGRLSWRGDVDDVAEIRIKGRRVEFRSRSGEPVRNVRFDLRGAALPRHDVSLALDVARARGSVLVVQEPSARNGYTAIIRIIDRRGGYGNYEFNLDWF